MISGYRERGLATPITPDVIARAGVQDSLVRRTHAGLRLLDLIDEKGEPTQHLLDLRQVPSGEYKERLVSFVRDVYRDVFQFADPAKDAVDRVQDAFRSYTPHGQRDRMVTLFLGLCQEAGIIEEVPNRRAMPRTPQSRPSKGRNGGRKREVGEEPVRDTALRPTPTDQSTGLHPLLEGLIKTLPKVGTVWPEEAREMWTHAALANFKLLYKLAPENSEEGGGDDQEAISGSRTSS